MKMHWIAYKNTYNDLRHKKIGDLLKYMKRAKASVKKMLGKLSRGLTGFDALARAGRGSIKKAGDDVVAVVDKAEQFAAKMTLRFGSSHQK